MPTTSAPSGDDASLDHVLELADVARPRILGEHLHRFGRHRVHDVAVVLGETCEEIANELGNVFAALAQRRHGQVNDVQAVEEILAERALAHHVAQVAVRRGDDADVDAPARVIGPDLLQLAGLHESQQQALHPHRHLADFVEENRPLVGELELARACRDRRPVKLPLTWPNSSDSSSVSGRPAQLTATNGRCPRGLCAWTALATSSLPTPLSPVIEHFGVGPRDALDLLLELDHHAAGAGQLNVAVVPHRSTSCPIPAARSPFVWAGAPL